MAIAFAVGAQQDHFVYLQTDNGKPFYVKMDNKILSSSSEGYIILPKMTTGIYPLTVGFPKKEYPEETFRVSVDSKNRGFLIKHFEDKGLELFNMETLALIDGDQDTMANKVVTAAKHNDSFTKMLANVIKDSSILENHQMIVETAVKPADTTKVITQISASATPSVADTSTSVNNAGISTSAIAQGDASAPDVSDRVSTGNISPNASAAAISKVMSMRNEYGLQMLYADGSGRNRDTIEVFMSTSQKTPAVDSNVTTISNTSASPAGKQRNNDNSGYPVNKNQNSPVDTSQLTITPTVISTDNKKPGFILRKDPISDTTGSEAAKTAPEQVFYIGPPGKKNVSDDVSVEEKKGMISDVKIKNAKQNQNHIDKQAPDKQMEVLPKVVSSSEVNSDCKAFADNEDFLKLRKKMAAENSREDMLKVAKKFFRSKCYSTEQIKDLSYLFLTDEGKYMFFDAAYPHASDSNEYSILESQLKDVYYLNRFKAMIRR